MAGEWIFDCDGCKNPLMLLEGKESILTFKEDVDLALYCPGCKSWRTFDIPNRNKKPKDKRMCIECGRVEFGPIKKKSDPIYQVCRAGKIKGIGPDSDGVYNCDGKRVVQYTKEETNE